MAAQIMHSRPDGAASLDDETLKSLAEEHELPQALNAPATEEQMKAYYASLNTNTLKSKDIYPERSLKEQKRMFEKEQRDLNKQFRRKRRSFFMPGPNPEPKLSLFDVNASRTSSFFSIHSLLKYPQNLNKSIPKCLTLTIKALILVGNVYNPIINCELTGIPTQKKIKWKMHRIHLLSTQGKSGQTLHHLQSPESSSPSVRVSMKMIAVIPICSI